MIRNTGRWNKYTLKEDKKLFYYPQEWKKIMDIAKPMQKHTLMLLINTGARINEARHIRPEDVDFDRHNLVLKKTKVRSKKGETRPNPRHIPISSKFSRYLKFNAKKLTDDGYYPILTTQATGHAIKYMTKKIGRKDWRDFSAHNVRKTFECWLMALGVDGFKVAKHMGHTAAVAINEYISPDIFTFDDKNKIRQILGDLYGYDKRRF